MSIQPLKTFSRVEVSITAQDVLRMKPKMSEEQAARFLEANRDFIEKEMAHVGNLAILGCLAWRNPQEGGQHAGIRDISPASLPDNAGAVR